MKSASVLSLSALLHANREFHSYLQIDNPTNHSSFTVGAWVNHLCVNHDYRLINDLAGRLPEAVAEQTPAIIQFEDFATGFAQGSGKPMVPVFIKLSTKRGFAFRKAGNAAGVEWRKAQGDK